MSSFEVLSLKTSESVNNSCKFHCCVPVYSHHQTYFDQSHMPDSDDHNVCSDHVSFWSKSPRSDSPLSSGNGTINYVDSYNIQQQNYYQQLQITNSYKTGNSFMDSVISVPMEDLNRPHHIGGVPIVRGVKRRNTANKKERRRTQSINAAFHELREKIPNVPADTKLSKIKTLRLATSYISYLMAVLEANEPAIGFRADLVRRVYIHRDVQSSGKIRIIQHWIVHFYKAVPHLASLLNLHKMTKNQIHYQTMLEKRRVEPDGLSMYGRWN